MSEQIQNAEVVENETEQAQEQPLQVEVTQDVAFNLKLQEYDKNIAAHKAEAAKLEAERAAFVYDSNIKSITEHHKEKMIKQQIEDEARKKMLEKK